MSPTKNHILIGLSESERTKFGKEDFASQSVPQKVFSALWEVESEVNNGGFSQYFVNSSAESAHFVVDALRMIGAPKTADICQRAIATAFPAGLPKSEKAIRSAAADFSNEVLEKCRTCRPRILFLPPQSHGFAFRLRLSASGGVWHVAEAG
jgi:hypothetical protein